MASDIGEKCDVCGAEACPGGEDCTINALRAENVKLREALIEIAYGFADKFVEGGPRALLAAIDARARAALRGGHE